ncbi:MAG: DUF922 domain-containing protein [Candidatus Saccharibacteria bacterium]|nr:DUF922 domain-containing protein [Candidatus Saccharibacteria bacterium]
MPKSRSLSALLKSHQNILLITTLLIISVFLLFTLWQQKTIEFAQAVETPDLHSVLLEENQTIEAQNQSKMTTINTAKAEQDHLNTQKTLASAQNKKTTAANNGQLPTVPSCTKIAHYIPGPIDLTKRPAGLTHLIDSPIYFQVFGRDTTTIQSQIWNCSPNVGKSQVHAISQSHIGISYIPKLIDFKTNTCQLSNIKVGLRNLITLPSWQADNFTSDATKQSMSRFLTGLKTHEDGHTQIDLFFAKKLLAELKKISGPCSSINNSVQNIYQHIKRELDAAQYNYEIETNYGARQGAWL